METKVFSTSAADITLAAELLRNGKRVIFPTETVYGLGANALDEKAVKSIFEAKGRPSDNPLIVHIADRSQLSDIAEEIPPKAKLLMDAFWPGPLTIILKRKNTIPDAVTAGRDTVGIRNPQNSTALALLKACKLPIAAPSANISGRPSPTDAKYVIEDMMGRVEGIIDGGDCTVGVESTVIDMTSDVPTILRPGGVTAEEISELLGEVIGGREKADEKEVPKAPGMKYTHYAPKAPVKILKGSIQTIEKFLNSRPNCGILTFDEFNLNTKAKQISLGNINNPKDSAQRLFRALRDMDKMGVCEIFAPEIGNKGLWAAVKNRLYKAAGEEILDLSKGEIIFVCTGNTCRSPMAESIFNSLKSKGYFATSAGIYAQSGDKPSLNSVLALKEIGIDIKNHISTPLTYEAAKNAALILTLTTRHKYAILSLDRGFSDKVMTLSEFVGESKEISDPFGGDLEVYRACRDEIKDLVKKAYDKL